MDLKTTIQTNFGDNFNQFHHFSLFSLSMSEDFLILLIHAGPNVDAKIRQIFKSEVWHKNPHRSPAPTALSTVPRRIKYNLRKRTAVM